MKTKTIKEKEYLLYSSEQRNNFIGIVIENIFIKYIKNGLWHRIDGPAIIYNNNHKFYYLNGLRATKEQQEFLHDLMKLKGLI